MNRRRARHYDRPLEPHERVLTAVLGAAVLVAGLVAVGLRVPLAVVVATVWAVGWWPPAELLPADRTTGLPHPGRVRRARMASAWWRSLWLPRLAHLGFGDPGDSVGAERSWWPPRRLSSWWWLGCALAAAMLPAPPPLTWLESVGVATRVELPGWYWAARSAQGWVVVPVVWWWGQAGAAAWRASRTETETAPVTLLDRGTATAGLRSTWHLACVTGIVAAAALVRLGDLGELEQRRVLLAVAVGIAVCLAVVSWGCCRAATGPWRHRLSEQERWGELWRQVGVRPDQIPGWAAESTAGVVSSVIFAAAPGADPAVYNQPRKLANALDSSQVLVAPVMDANDVGELVAGTAHPSGFRVSWTTAPLGPAPHLRRDLDSATAEFAAQVAVTDAFAALKLGEPLLVLFQALGNGPGGVLVETMWRLQPGVTYEDVARLVPALTEKLGVDWLRVGQWQSAAAEAGQLPTGMVTLVYGARPDTVADLGVGVRAQLDRLDWGWLWWACDVKGQGGDTPRLLNKQRNGDVFRLDFAHTPGVGFPKVLKAVERLKTASRMSFVVPQRCSDPQRFQLVTAVRDPLPATAPLPEPAAGEWSRIPIGVGIVGEPVVWDASLAPHGLVMGQTLSGKSVVLQCMVTQALCLGWDVGLVDAQKHGADFQFALPWLKWWAGEIGDASDLLDDIYSLVQSRQRVNARHGANSWHELPKVVRPRPLLLVVEEAFSLVLHTAGRSSEAKAINADKDAILDHMGRIAREARAVGVHLVLTAQRGDRTILKGEMVHNLGLRVAMGGMGATERTMTFRTPDLVPELGETVPKGRGVVEQEGSPTTLFQGHFATNDRLTELLGRRLGTPSPSSETITAPRPSALPDRWAINDPERWN